MKRQKPMFIKEWADEFTRFSKWYARKMERTLGKRELRKEIKMARDIIQVQYPALNHEEAIANIAITVKEVNPKNGIKIDNAFDNKNNSLFIHIYNEGTQAELLTVKAGDSYPNSMLGDIVIELPVGHSAIQLADLSRFARDDKSIELDFSDSFNGHIFAVAKYLFAPNNRIDW